MSGARECPHGVPTDTCPDCSKCDHPSWKYFEYEPDTNAGGYKECRECGHQVALEVGEGE